MLTFASDIFLRSLRPCQIDDSTLKALKQFYAPYDKIYGYGTEVSGPQVLVDAA